MCQALYQRLQLSADPYVYAGRWSQKHCSPRHQWDLSVKKQGVSMHCLLCVHTAPVSTTQCSHGSYLNKGGLATFRVPITFYCKSGRPEFSQMLPSVDIHPWVRDTHHSPQVLNGNLSPELLNGWGRRETHSNKKIVTLAFICTWAWVGLIYSIFNLITVSDG